MREGASWVIPEDSPMLGRAALLLSSAFSWRVNSFLIAVISPGINLRSIAPGISSALMAYVSSYSTEGNSINLTS